MQVIKIGTTTFKVKSDRTNLFELVNKCHKKTRQKVGKSRTFPVFSEGMSTSEYVRLYFLRNEGVFGAYSSAINDQFVLNEDPCTLYTGEDEYFEEEELLAA